MTKDFYYTEGSAPCRAVMLTMKAVNVDFHMKEINLMAGEQMKPEFVAINPQHCVPTLVDGDLKIWESRAICTYLASQYGKDDSLYPTDAKAKADVDRLLYFDMGTLYHRFGEYVYPVFFGKVDKPDPEKLKRTQEALGWLNSFLAGHKFAAGNTITVADHSLVASVSTMQECNIDLSGHPNILAWLERCKNEMPGYKDANDKGAKIFGTLVKSKLGE